MNKMTRAAYAIFLFILVFSLFDTAQIDTSSKSLVVSSKDESGDKSLVSAFTLRKRRETIADLKGTNLLIGLIHISDAWFKIALRIHKTTNKRKFEAFETDRKHTTNHQLMTYGNIACKLNGDVFSDFSFDNIKIDTIRHRSTS